MTRIFVAILKILNKKHLKETGEIEQTIHYLTREEFKEWLKTGKVRGIE